MPSVDCPKGFTVGVPVPIIPSPSGSFEPPSTTSLIPSPSESKSLKSAGPSPSVLTKGIDGVKLPLLSAIATPSISTVIGPVPINPSPSPSGLLFSTVSLIPSLSESKSCQSGTLSPSVSGGKIIPVPVKAGSITGGKPSEFTVGIFPLPSSIRPSPFVSLP